MKIYQYHAHTLEFLKEADADESPMEEGVFLIPANATDIAPPSKKIGEIQVFVNGKWVIENDKRGTVYWLPDGTKHVQADIGDLPDGALLVEPPAPKKTEAEILRAAREARANAYRDESDPLFFKAQRGEATMDEWLAKVAEIKANIPDGVMP